MFSLSPSPSPSLNFISHSSPPFFPQKPHLFINGTFLTTPFHKSLLLTKTHNPNSTSPANNSVTEQKNDAAAAAAEEEDYQVLTAIRSEYNNIVILESENSKVLLLDDSGNIHSILYNDQKWTNSYWDEFCNLPAVIPDGPIAVFGLGGGTVAHQLLQYWPALIIDGWELDRVLVDRARMYFRLSELEVANESTGGVLRVCVGDALSPSAVVEGGYAGIVVDLFANAEVLPELQVAQTWLDMKRKLMPNGRIMVNCGGANNQLSSVGYEANLTVKALCEAFGVKFVNWKKMPENESGNYLAFTGPLPDLDMWSESVPDKLRLTVKEWRPCDL